MGEMSEVEKLAKLIRELLTWVIMGFGLAFIAMIALFIVGLFL